MLRSRTVPELISYERATLFIDALLNACLEGRVISYTGPLTFGFI